MKRARYDKREKAELVRCESCQVEKREKNILQYPQNIYDNEKSLIKIENKRKHTSFIVRFARSRKKNVI